MSDEYSEAYLEAEILRQNLQTLQGKLMEQAALLRALEDSESKIKKLLLENESLKRELIKLRNKDSDDLSLVENILNEKQLAEAKARHCEQQLLNLQKAYQQKELQLARAETELKQMELRLRTPPTKEYLNDPAKAFKAIKDKDPALPVKRRADTPRNVGDSLLGESPFQFPRAEDNKRKQKRQGSFMEPYAPSSSITSQMYTPAYVPYSQPAEPSKPADPTTEAFQEKSKLIKTLLSEGFEIGSTNASMWADSMLNLRPNVAAAYFYQELSGMQEFLKASAAVELTHLVFESLQQSKEWFSTFLKSVKEFAVSLPLKGKTFEQQDYTDVTTLQSLMLEAYLESSRALKLFSHIRALIYLLALRKDFDTYTQLKALWPSVLEECPLKSLHLMDVFLANRDLSAMLAECLEALNVYSDTKDLYKAFKAALTLLEPKPAYEYYCSNLWPLLSQKVPGRAVIIMSLGHVLKQLSSHPAYQKVLPTQVGCLKEIIGDTKFATFSREEQEAAKFALAKVGH
mmetsp:Transcript_5992/g.10591  ORF Transcript_5992/g.10591 Transcript_5992/m.10591 type:complete len:516 (-) Transcript_5992:458-2005(-)